MESTATRSDGTTTMTGPKGDPWVVMTIIGEEENPSTLDEMAPALITLARANPAEDAPEVADEGAEQDPGIGTLTLEDDVVVTIDGVTLTTEEALTLLNHGIVLALKAALEERQ